MNKTNLRSCPVQAVQKGQWALLSVPPNKRKVGMCKVEMVEQVKDGYAISYHDQGGTYRLQTFADNAVLKINDAKAGGGL